MKSWVTRARDGENNGRMGDMIRNDHSGETGMAAVIGLVVIRKSMKLRWLRSYVALVFLIIQSHVLM